MVTKCCAVGCRERSHRGCRVSFHSFPKDPLRRKIWTIAVWREGFVPASYSRLCSNHFTEDCYDKEKLGGNWLKANAVPTLFDFSNPSKTKKLLIPSHNRYVSTEETCSPSSSSNLSSFSFPERPEKLTNGTSTLKSFTPIERNSATEQLYVSSASAVPLSLLKVNAVPTLLNFSDNSKTETTLSPTHERCLSAEETCSPSSSFPFPERPVSSEKLTIGPSILNSFLTSIERNPSTKQLYVSSASRFPLSTSSKPRRTFLFTYKKACVPSKVEKEDSSITQYIKKEDEKHIRYLECDANSKGFDDERPLNPTIRRKSARKKLDLEKRFEVAKKEKDRLQMVLKSIRRKIRYLRRANVAMKNFLDEESENKIHCDSQKT